MSNDFNLIHMYTRREALADGVLVDATDMATQAGFRVPVALTAPAWAKCVTVPPGVDCQDEAGRLWDVLMTLRFAVKGASGGERELPFRLLVQTRPDERPELVELKVVGGPDDDGEPCLTVMMPDED